MVKEKVEGHNDSKYAVNFYVRESRIMVVFNKSTIFLTYFHSLHFLFILFYFNSLLNYFKFPNIMTIFLLQPSLNITFFIAWWPSEHSYIWLYLYVNFLFPVEKYAKYELIFPKLKTKYFIEEINFTLKLVCVLPFWLSWHMLVHCLINYEVILATCSTDA